MRSAKTLESPSLQEAAEVIRNGILSHKTILLVGNCHVNYVGRASSRLEPGDRIVIIKEDGSVMVHRPTGYEPVNWQPPGCIFQTNVEGEELVIRAIRRKPRESIRIMFSELYLLSILSLRDSGEFSLYASEEDMQRAILLQPSIIEEGLKIISYEKRVEPGFIDVYGVDGEGRFVVMEIKRRVAGKDAVLQLAKYVESLRETTTHKIRGILVAPKLAKGAQRALTSLGLEFKPLDPKRCAEILRRHETRRLMEFFS